MKKGFTLIELTISLTIASILFISGFFILSGYIRAYNKLNAKVEALQIKQSVIMQMAREIKSADSIQSATAAKLTLKIGKSLISYDLANAKVRRIKDSSASYLTDTGQVKSLRFSYSKPGLVFFTIDSLTTGAYCRNAK